MAEKEKEKESKPDGLEELGEELVKYLSNLAQDLIGKVEDKIGGAGGGGGTAMKAGARILKGENPAKAFMGEKTKGIKDSVVGGAKGLIPGVGGGGDSGGGGGSGGSGNVKAINIIESIDIPVPLRIVYDQWSQVEDFGSFTKGVQGVNKKDDVTSEWTAKVAFSTRSWTATVQEQIPDELIRWTSEGPKGSTEGVVTFHEITPHLTRIVVVVEYTPAGFFEKTANIWRAQGRRLRLDLKHFARHVTLHADEEELEGWRGEIHDGEVTRSHEDALEDEESSEKEDHGEGDEDENEDGEEEEEEEEDEEDYDDEEDEDEDEEGYDDEEEPEEKGDEK